MCPHVGKWLPRTLKSFLGFARKTRPGTCTFTSVLSMCTRKSSTAAVQTVIPLSRSLSSMKALHMSFKGTVGDRPDWVASAIVAKLSKENFPVLS